MFLRLLLLSVIIPIIVKSADLHMGKVSHNSKKIYDQTKSRKGSLWVRIDEIEVYAPLGYRISAIVINDLKSCKDGLVIIESGGIGQKKVIILLESPTILKGFSFRVKVYANKKKRRFVKRKHKHGKKKRKGKESKEESNSKSKESTETMEAESQK